MAATYEFFMVLQTLASIQKSLPAKITSIIYDPRFTPDRVIDEVRREDVPPIDIPGFYQHVFADLDDTVARFDCLELITSSSELDENLEVGDFDYYAGQVTRDVAVLYMKSTHPWALPSRAILYGPTVQFDFSNYQVAVEAVPVNNRIRQKIMITNPAIRKIEVKDWLRMTDRPLMNPDNKL